MDFCGFRGIGGNNNRGRETAVADELRALARDVRRIGCGYRADPETIALAKEDVSRRLVGIARSLEAGR